VNSDNAAPDRTAHDLPNDPSRRCRLLIADDEADLRTLVRMIFDDLGWWVDEAADGCEALRKLQTEVYDLVLLDHRMPYLTGGEVYGALCAKGINIPTVLVSAAKQVEEIAGRHGIPYLEKPFSIDDLLDVVGEFKTHC
jgi:CheY-like chemotaxis protein